ncbi:fumarylacetoacetate hydrolase family protein [Pigmentiphaga soli]|uniref:Fumarylacetoacetate hydrolase family protein n=1 Tax=Pigmentiphaga soli TaxID=1007095 RepID=A0ABP8GLQ3_9BURK
MKLCTFEVATPLGPARRVGVRTPAGIVDAAAARSALLERRLAPAAAQRVGEAQVPPDMIALIGSGGDTMAWVAEAVEHVLAGGAESTGGGRRTRYGEAEVRLLAPVPRPAGLANFSVWPEHSVTAAAKGFHVTPNAPDARVKPYWKGNPDSVAGPGAVLEFPPYANSLDVECELVCIVGTGGKNLDRDQAGRAIAGYSILNDASAREIQLIEKKAGRGPSKGKDFDGGNVMGPWLVTPDEVGDVRSLRVSLHINGEEVSAADTLGMVWDFAEMLSYLSLGQTVHPGQVISGGCYPRGSALDLDRTLDPGDEVELRVSKLGALRCRIGSRPASAPYRL